MVSMYYPARTGAGRAAAYPTLLNGLTPENPEVVSHEPRGTSLAGADVRGLRDRR